MPNVFDQFDEAPAAGGNVFDQFDEGRKRTPPTKLKIGAEGFGEAMRSTLAEHPIAGRLAAFGSFPRSLYEGAKQRIDELRAPKLGELITGKQEEPGAAQNREALRAMQETYPLSALSGGLATAGLASFIPGGASVGGQALFGGATGFLTPTERGESAGKNALIGAALGGGAAGALKLAGMGTKALLSRSAAKAAGTAAQQSVRDETISLAQAAGLKVPRTVTGGGEVAEQIENLGMRGAIAREFSRANQPVINSIARTEAGLPHANVPLKESTLEAARYAAAAPYREVAAVSPRAKEALSKLGDARREAGEYWADYTRNQTKKALDEARRLDGLAKQYERVIDKEATAIGRSDLLPALRDARVRLAKNYDVLAALNKGNGNVDARILGRMYDKRGEKAMTGGLATIGRAAEAFGSYMNEAATGTSHASGYGVLKPMAALGLGIGGYSASEHYGLGPWGAAAGGLALLSGPARSIALSRLMQKAPSYAPSATLRLSDLAARTGSRLIPMTGAALALQPDNQ